MNDEFRVPTLRLETEVEYAGEVLSGAIYLPVLASHHQGAPRPEEWINEPNSFFPFLVRGQSHAIILNKERVRVLSVALNEEFDIREEDRPFECAVTVECGDRLLRGNIVLELPPEHSRLLDYMNKRQAFVPLWSKDLLHLIRKSCITKVFETEGV